MYDIQYTARAVQDLRFFRKSEQKAILQGIEVQLCYEPLSVNRNRKRMRANPIGEWELRLGDFRVIYNVEESVEIVEIQRIGEKRGNLFFFSGEREDR
jgi:mRNA-degrading endonuclease RelE of RelBE toxin-antitoxin system